MRMPVLNFVFKYSNSAPFLLGFDIFEFLSARQPTFPCTDNSESPATYMSASLKC